MPDLLYLIGFGFAAFGLKVQDLFGALLPFRVTRST
jgi:hypothetical protein